MDNPCGMSRQNRSPSKSVPEDFQPIEPYCDAAIAPAFQIEGQLNEVYEKRLAEINEEANGDPTLKEITYKEWITMLREINKTLITNIQDMERETTERLALLQRKVSANCRLSNQSSELCKYRRDIAGLMQLIRNGKQYGDWNIDKYCFETITAKDIFGTDLPCCDPNLNKIEPESTDQSECAVKGTGTKLKTKLLDNVKALAYEVADKHDEIRDLKKQILSMEDEIQKAQKKIQLKDDVIKELRNDLKALPKFVGAWNCRTTDHASPTSSGLSASIMSDIKSECEMTTPRVVESYSNRDSIHSLTTSPLEEDEDDEQNFIKCLREELNQLFEMRRSYDQNVEDQKRSIQEQQTRLCDMVEKLLKCNSQFHNKLRFYRRELLNLDNPQHNNRTCSIASDCDSGISSDSDPDVKIINSVRNRVSNFIDENQRLRKCQQLMQIEFEDVSCKLLAKSEIFDKTSKALREVTDALSNAICKPIAYEKMFGQCQSMSNNPIVDAVDGLMETVKIRDQTINDLRKELMDARRSNEELDCCCKTLKLELADMKQLTPANIQSENRVMLFQNQEFSKRLLKQNEDLKSRLCNQEDDIKALHIRICQLEKRSCGKCSSLSQIDEQPRRPSREESGGDIRQFEIDLKRKSKIVECLKSENASLNDELSDLRRQRAKAKLLERRPMVMSRSSLASSLQHTDAEVASKLSLTQEKLREQSKELQKANREVQSLQEELGHLRRSEEILTKERDLLKTELCALKESQASAAGTQQSLQEQLLGTIDELYLVKEQLREVTEAKDNIESGLRAEINTIQERRADLLDNYNKLVEEFNKINKEYQKVVQIEQEKTRLILTFNTWKKEQLKIEKDMRRKVEIFEDHIRELLADKERLLTQLEETENDNRTLLLSIDNSSAYGRRQSTSPSRGYQVFAQSSSTDPVSKVIENVRTATRKMSKQRTLMDDESRYLSN